MVARALFRRLFDPNCFDKMFLIPASSSTVRIELPAITPEPGGKDVKQVLQLQIDH